MVQSRGKHVESWLVRNSIGEEVSASLAGGVIMNGMPLFGTTPTAT